MDASSPSSLGLPKSRRIKQRRDFARNKVEGRRLMQGCLILNWMTLPAGATSRLGVVTSRRIGNAVTRNRARRLLREAFRLGRSHLTKPVDVVLVARQSIVGKPLATVRSDFTAALKKAKIYRETSGTFSPEQV
jgi:ribonuclease P protein component